MGARGNLKWDGKLPITRLLFGVHGSKSCYMYMVRSCINLPLDLNRYSDVARTITYQLEVGSFGHDLMFQCCCAR